MKRRKLFFFALFVLVAVAGAFLFSDDLLEMAIESSLSNLMGTEVDIDDLEINFPRHALLLKRLQVTDPIDPRKNLLEAARVLVDFQRGPLLHYEIAIDRVVMSDLRIMTRRARPGRVDKHRERVPDWVERSRQHLLRQIAEAPELDPELLHRRLDLDTLFEAVPLKSLAKIEEIAHRIDSTFLDLENTRLPQIDRQLDTPAANDLSEMDSNPHRTLGEIDTLRQALTELVATFDQALSGLDSLVEDDFQALVRKARLTAFTPENVGIMLFGSTMSRATVDVLHFMAELRALMPVEPIWWHLEQGKEKSRRSFHVRLPRPKISIAEVTMKDRPRRDNVPDDVLVHGNIRGISSDPKAAGQPLTFELEIVYPAAEAKTYYFTGTVDHTRNIPEERFELFSSGKKLVRFDLPKRPYLPIAIEAERGKLGAKFVLVGDDLQFRTYFFALPVNFVFGDSLTEEDRTARVCRRVFESREWLKIIAEVRGQIPDLTVEVVSNVNELLSKRLKEILGETVTASRRALRRRLDKLVRAKKREAYALLQSHRQKVLSKLKPYKNHVPGRTSTGVPE